MEFNTTALKFNSDPYAQHRSVRTENPANPTATNTCGALASALVGAVDHCKTEGLEKRILVLEIDDKQILFCTLKITGSVDKPIYCLQLKASNSSVTNLVKVGADELAAGITSFCDFIRREFCPEIINISYH